MARSDLIVGIVRAASRSDTSAFRRSLEALVADERAKQHHVFADRLAEYLGQSGNGVDPAPILPHAPDGIFEVLQSRQPERRLDTLVLPELVQSQLLQVIEEQHRRELLRAHSLEPRHRILLKGPPGNGKTSVAEAIAEALMLPFYVARYEGIVGSYLGETSNRLKRVFDFVRTRPSVLFFDEFDTLGKERGDPHDTGEIKRVVSSLLLQIDDLPSHVVVVTATNHPELLDRAAWRRFEVSLYLPPPTNYQIRQRLIDMARRLDAVPDSVLVYAEMLAGSSFSDLEMIETDAQRQVVLNQGAVEPSTVLSSRIVRWIQMLDSGIMGGDG